MDELKELIKQASKTKMSSEEREHQRQSFAYGNTKFENDRITRATIDRASKELSSDTVARGE